MAKETIIIEVDRDGHVSVEGHGFVGSDCLTLTADLERALGTVENRTLKPEARQAKSTLRTTTR